MRWLKISTLYLSAFVLAFGAGFAIDKAFHQHNTYTAANWDDVGTIERDFSYGDKPAQKFDLYLPKDKSRPAYGLVVFLHGGGFTTGDKKDDTEILKWIAAKGYVASGIGYTLHNEQNPGASVKTQVDEIKAAMPHVVAKARELGYPIDKMAVGGGSAGHALAAIYAYRESANAPVPIAFAYGWVGPVSFEMEDMNEENTARLQAVMPVLVGEKFTSEMMASGEYKEKIRPIEAYHWVNAESPPAIFGFGKLDKIMPFDIQPMQDALQKHKVPHDVFI